MLIGIITGFTAALVNTAGYLFNARFLLYYKSPVRLLILTSLVMMAISLPFMLIFFPFSALPSLWYYFAETILACVLFLIGQGAFFGALKFFEASRLSSLLGLKIVVLSTIFILCGGSLNLVQIIAVLMAASAALIFNWSGAGKTSVKGWLLLSVTLCCYSMVDFCETDLVIKVHECTQWSKFHSALVVVPVIYTFLGLLTLPLVGFYRPDKDQLSKVLPCAGLWLISQVALLCCFAFLQPVFGNVILATRGIFSVLAGFLLPYLGLSALDSKIPLRLWVRRIAAALLMLGAIAVYSFGSVK
ncbi:MAG: hypothetical protein E7050_00625 [Lentisphaerae bacterium]|nr:hypothetical protein [Lentisphaerota bacterium]